MTEYEQRKLIADVLVVERDAMARELERWRHGVTVEGDFVCPHQMEAERLRDLRCDCDEEAAPGHTGDCITQLPAIVEAMREEIERMRPVVEAARAVVERARNSSQTFSQLWDLAVAVDAYEKEQG